MATVYAIIILELSKAGLHAVCEELEEDVFCIDGDLTPLCELINKAEDFCNHHPRYVLPDKGREELKREKQDEEN